MKIVVGNAADVLTTLNPESVRCVVTSPPYWGLRDYGNSGQLGLEPSFESYVSNLADVFDEVRRVLAPDGTLWLNLGDCYATGAGKVGDHPGGGEQGQKWKGETRESWRRDKAPIGPMTQPNRMPQPGLKPKDLVGIPWRVAFELQARGWWLRSDIIWSKPNPMPESVTDRPSKAHEYLFLLTKSERYYYDHEAIKEDGVHRASGNTQHKYVDTGDEKHRTKGGLVAMSEKVYERSNKRSVWTVPTQPFTEAHFATFPPRLIEPCILAGTAKGDTVVDPFAGAGTTGLVATRLGRDFIGIELNPEYAEMAKRRIEGDAPLWNEVAVE